MAIRDKPSGRNDRLPGSRHVQPGREAGAYCKSKIRPALQSKRISALLFPILFFFLVAVSDAGSPSIPVLCYHAFFDESGDRSPGELDTSYERFEAHLDYLAKEGFETVIPDPGTDWSAPSTDHSSGVAGEKAGPRKPVVVTFDDGHRSQLRAARMLEKREMRGIFFVIPSLIDDPDYPHMNSEELGDLAGRGHLIAAHGHRHQSMPVSGPEIVATLDTVPDLLSSLANVEDSIIHSLAYPYGLYTPAVYRAMRSRYPLQYTVNPGYWDGSSGLIPRIMITLETRDIFYRSYISGKFLSRRKLFMEEQSGSRQSVLHFSNPERVSATNLYILAISPDYEGQYYQSFPAAPYLSQDGGPERLKFDVKEYLETHHSRERRALSFVLKKRDDSGDRFVSEGYLIWVAIPDE